MTTQKQDQMPEGDLWICRRGVVASRHEGNTGYEYYEPVRPFNRAVLIEAKPQEVDLARMIIRMDEAARSQGLYVGAGKDPRLSDDEQEGPIWNAIKSVARQIVDRAEKGTPE